MLSPKAEEIRELRKEFRLTQTEFARIFGRKYRMVVNWENGTGRMPGDLWESYLVYFRKQKPRHFDDKEKEHNG